MESSSPPPPNGGSACFLPQFSASFSDLLLAVTDCDVMPDMNITSSATATTTLDFGAAEAADNRLLDSLSKDVGSAFAATTTIPSTSTRLNDEKENIFGHFLLMSANPNPNHQYYDLQPPSQPSPFSFTPWNIFDDSTDSNRNHQNLGAQMIPHDGKVEGKRPMLSEDDGYNWRKYGQKQMKGTDKPRSYYKCTHHHCPTRKKVERTVEGDISHIVYIGTHNHDKPRCIRRHGSSSHPASLFGTPVNSSEFSLGEEHDELPDVKRRRELEGANEGEDSILSRRITIREPRIVVQTTSDVDILPDGYKWRKYGQKVVKGNTNPRSYYKCTTVGCPVRKNVERLANEPKSVITTYEGKHNHDIPVARGTDLRAMKHSSDISFDFGTTENCDNMIASPIMNSSSHSIENPLLQQKNMEEFTWVEEMFPLQDYVGQRRE